MSSGFSLEGPIGEKLSFVTGIRTTYYDLFTIKKRIEYKYKSDINYLGYTFYDANAKLTFHASDKHRIFINFFSGSDFNKNCDKTETSSMNSENFTKYVVNNLCLSVGNRLTLNAKAMWHNLFTFSNYGNSLNSKYHQIYKGLTTIENYNSETLIKEFNLQSRFEYFGFKGNVIKSGFEYSYYQFVPGISHTYSENYTSGSKTDTVQGYLTPILSHETSFYFEDDIAIGKQIFLNIGMRGVFFRSRSTNYLKAEPRFSIRAQLGKNLSTKANYTIMNQFNHVVVSTFNIYEKEVWIASTKNIPPQQAQQFSFGIFGTAPVINMEFSAETYYKTMNNLLEYKAPTSGDIAITDLEAMVVKGGKGEAYGFEFQSKYSAKRFSVDASYVLSWNYRQFDEINNGAWYPFLFDRRHQFSFLTSLILGKHYSLNTNFQFSTGSPCTIPDSYVSTRSDTYYEYYTFSEINNYRMPDYHRLDLALVKREKIKKGRIQQFSLNIYNVFARQNPIRIYFEKGKVFQTSLFTIIPTISYSLEF